MPGGAGPGAAVEFGTVGSKEKAELAKKNGCHHTILYRDEDFVAKVKDITSGKLCDVVYDGSLRTQLRQLRESLAGDR